jgi:hypothetical protein
MFTRRLCNHQLRSASSAAATVAPARYFQEPHGAESSRRFADYFNIGAFAFGGITTVYMIAVLCKENFRPDGAERLKLEERTRMLQDSGSLNSNVPLAEFRESKRQR